MLNRLRLFEKTLLPLVLTATLLAITIGMGVTVLHSTVASYREILSRNAPAVLRIERLNALTDVVGYSIARNLGYHCLGADADACARAQRALDAAAAEGAQRLDEADRFDPARRADYEHFRQAFGAVVEPARAAMALGLRDDKAGAQAIGAISVNGETGLRWLQRTPPDIDRARSALERTVRDAGRASAIVSRVRGMVAKTAPEFVALDVNTVIQDVLVFIEDDSHRAKVTIRTRLDSRLPPVLGDPIQLQQVLLNLVVNGMDAMRANPARARALMLCSSAPTPKSIEVAVEDRGCGIDPDALDRVFTPFFTTKASGVGLGLSITRSIVEAHGGRIWAEGAQPSGTRFRFVLPIANAAQGLRSAS